MTDDTPTRNDIGLAVNGRLARIEAEVRLKGWEVAVAARRWDQAFGRLRGLADLYQPAETRPAWTRLLLTGLAAAAHANARGEAGRFVRAAAPNATRLGPDRLRDVFSVCAELQHDALAEEIGAALAREWPDQPTGWFVRADAAERGATRRGWRPDEKWAHDFRTALDRAGSLSEDWRRHIAVRWICAHLRSNGNRAEVRDTLKSLTLNELDDRDAIWLAFGLAHSEHWLDRVKACDILDDRLDRCETGGRILEEPLRDAVGAIFEHLSPNPHDAVCQRLQNLVDHPLLKDESKPWRAALDRRRSAPSPDTPLSDFVDATGPAAELRRAMAGDYSSLDDSFVADLCTAISDPTNERVEVVRRRLVTTPAPLWRAIAVAWPAWLAADISPALIDRFGKAWCARSAAPSYGWWQLAHHFEHAKAREAARSAAWRGIQAGEQHEQRDVILGKILARIVRDAELETLERWLVACEKIDQIDQTDAQSMGSNRPGK